jgi:hypothetical protein
MKEKDSTEKARKALRDTFATFQFNVGDRTWKREDLYRRQTVSSTAKPAENREQGTEN